MKKTDYSRRGKWYGALAVLGIFLLMCFLAYCVNTAVPRLGAAADIAAILATIFIGEKADKNIRARYDKMQEDSRK